MSLFIAFQLRQDGKWRRLFHDFRFLENRARLARKGIIGFAQRFNNILAKVDLAVFNHVWFIKIIQCEFAGADLGNLCGNTLLLDAVDLKLA